MTESGDAVRDRGQGAVAAARDRGGGGGGPWWWPRRRSMALDVALGAASAVECTVEGGIFADETGVPAVLGLLLGLVAGASLVLRRRWPIAVVLVAIAVTPAGMGFLLGVVGLYTLAASDVPRRIIVLLFGMMLLGGLIITFIQVQEGVGQDPDFNPPVWFIPLVALLMSVAFTVPPLLMGLYVGARRRLVVSLRERADGLERELSLLADRAEERAEWARNEERTRIAREMHDVVAHRVSLIVVHAAALQAVALKDPEKASRNAGLVGDMGRQALTELRTMLGVLRTPEHEESDAPARLAAFAASASASPDGSGEGSGDGSGAGEATGAGAPVAAQPAHSGADGPVSGSADGDEDVTGPTLGELDALLGESREAGMVVELSVEGERRGYAAGVERTAYRVVQEALTNVHKHAAGARTRVRLAHRTGEVALQVENEPPAADVADAGLPSGGNGLVGMRERVIALGGVFVSGPTDAGGFRVSAVIPGGAEA